MAVTQNSGIWVSVPQGNGYNVDSFKSRVSPHLQQLGLEVFIPRISKLKDIKDDGGTEEERLIKPDEKHFGLILTASGEWYDEVYRKLKVAEGVLRDHYGLQFDNVGFGYEKDYSVMFIRNPSINPKNGVEGNAASRK